jgi:hypothetical protein
MKSTFFLLCMSTIASSLYAQKNDTGSQITITATTVCFSTDPRFNASSVTYLIARDTYHLSGKVSLHTANLHFEQADSVIYYPGSGCIDVYGCPSVFGPGKSKISGENVRVNFDGNQQ